MLSIELRQSITEFLARSVEYQPLFELVKQIARFYDDSEQYILGHSEGGDKLNQAAAGLQSRFASLHSVTQTIVPRKVYRALEAFKSGVESSFDTVLQDDELLRQLVDGIEAFVAHYDAFLMQQTTSNAAKLMLEASTLNMRLSSVLSAFEFFDSAIRGQQVAPLEETQLSLVLYEADTLPGFFEKLEALQHLYSELCMLLNVSESEHPLRVGKIESGSLWVKVFGDTKVIQLIASLIEATVGYLHRQFTTEGKIGAVPKKLEALDAAIQVSSKLDALGVDTSEMNDHLRKSGVSISKNLATLLEDQPKVSINDRLFAVGALVEPLFLTQRKTLLLQNGNERIEPTMHGSTESDT